MLPDSVAPGAASVIVPPPDRGSPEIGFVYVNDRELTEPSSTVNVPL